MDHEQLGRSRQQVDVPHSSARQLATHHRMQACIPSSALRGSSRLPRHPWGARNLARTGGMLHWLQAATTPSRAVAQGSMQTLGHRATSAAKRQWAHRSLAAPRVRSSSAGCAQLPVWTIVRPPWLLALLNRVRRPSSPRAIGGGASSPWCPQAHASRSPAP